jgi:hypothetical protein
LAPETAARARFKKANALRPPERDFTISYCEIAGQEFVLQVTIFQGRPGCGREANDKGPAAWPSWGGTVGVQWAQNTRKIHE